MKNCDSKCEGLMNNSWDPKPKPTTQNTIFDRRSGEEKKKKRGSPASLVLSSPGNHVVHLLSENMLE
jgi:hypothetical protein